MDIEMQPGIMFLTLICAWFRCRGNNIKHICLWKLFINTMGIGLNPCDPLYQCYFSSYRSALKLIFKPITLLYEGTW